MHRRSQRGGAATTGDVVSACRRIGVSASVELERFERLDCRVGVCRGVQLLVKGAQTSSLCPGWLNAAKSR